MSFTAFDQPYALRPGTRQIDARPRGALAATMIGGGALFILLVSLLFGARAPVEDASPLAAADTPKTAAASAGGGAISALNSGSGAGSGAMSKKFASFDLSAPEFAKEPKSFTERLLDTTGGREESVIIGQFAPAGPFMRLDLVLSGGEKIANSDFFLDMTRHATQAGLSATRIGQPSPLVTRFGNFEVADIKLTHDGGEERACLAARFLNGKAPLEMAGLVCGVAARPIDRRTLGCILDRLDYLSNGENKAMDEFFLTAELDRGKGCAGGAAMTPTAAKSSWLDGHAIAPPLKKGKEAAPPAAAHARQKKKAAE